MSKNNLNSSDLENECEDVLYDVCQMRDIYPSKCAKKMQDIIHLQSKIKMKPINMKKTEKIKNVVITEEQMKLLKSIPKLDDDYDVKFRKLSESIDNLKYIAQQLKAARSCPINKSADIKRAKK